MSSSSDTNYLKAYSIADSKRKIDEIQMILTQKIGNNWKQVIFSMLLLLVSIILIIIYGINIDNNPHKDALSHLKVFFIIFILSICFFFIWIIIKPYTDSQQKGIVPFPPSDTLIPVDSSLCGTVPTLCDNAGDCTSLCASKQGESNYNYSCYRVTHPNTYYLGSKLEVGKSYCLPNISEINNINDCGTYTGRIVWSKNSDNSLSWKCQCLYPDIFSGSNCTKQIACKMEYTDGVIAKESVAVLQDKGENVWSGNSAPPADSKTPYDSLPDGTPRFKCSCQPGFYSTNGDPFTCNEDICYEGSSHSDVAKFDLDTNKCVCLPPTYKSNISGFCYPPEITDPNCHLNSNGGGCTYGISIFYRDDNTKTNIPVIYLNNGKYFMATKSPDKLLDITSVVNDNNVDKTKFIDITKTILKDAFYSYEEFSTVASNDYLAEIKSNLNADMLDILHKLVLKAGKDGPGVARKCNSYFYRRDGYDNCNDMLSKTGTEPIANNMYCGQDNSNVVIDLNYYPWGYHCDCGTTGRKNPGCATVKLGWNTVKDGDGTRQIYSTYIDQIVCNDYDTNQIKEGPQICIGDCVADGGDLANDQDYKSCCLYEVDLDNKPVKNIKYRSRFVGLNEYIGDDGTNADVKGADNKKCRNRARASCSDGTTCLFSSDSNVGICNSMDKNNVSICCPNGSVGGPYDPFTGKWCNYLDQGERCYYDRQCNDKLVCKGAGNNKSAGGGVCGPK